jgi:hypothetical protein
MKTSFYTLSMIVSFLFAATQTSKAMTASGPSYVCPSGTYTYTVSGAPFGTSYYRWALSYTGFGVGTVSTGSGPSSTMNVTLNSTTEGFAYITFEALTGSGGLHLDSYGLIVTRQLPRPATPNDGLVLFCSANETVSVNSSPYIPYDVSNPSNIASCLFHCSYLWQSPSGWNFQSGINSPSNNIDISATSNSLVSPSSVSNGNNGTVYVVAQHSQCSASVNTSSSATLWVGAPSVSNALVNGSPGGTPTYVSSGYANLSVNTGGGGTTNWYIANGSGSLYPSGANCTASWSGFLRVVVETSNRCGTGGNWTFYLTTQSGYPGYRIAPNPAKDNLSLLLDYNEMVGEVIQNVALYDSENKAWYSSDANQLKNTIGDKNVIEIPTKDFPRGTYFLHVKMGDEIKKQQIVLD